MMVLLFDGLWIALGVGLVFWYLRLSRGSYAADALRRMYKKSRVQIAFYIILFYFFIGFVDQIKIPGSGEIRDPSLLDYVGKTLVKERTYSAPFASRVTGVTGDENDPRSVVKGTHLLGTDVNGYDVFFQVMKGSGTALKLAFGVVLISFPIGILLGMIAGFFGGIVDDLIQWLYTTVASIPWLLFVIAFLMVFGRGIFWIIIAIGITGWVGLARLVRGETMKLKNLDYIVAARAAGVPLPRILLRHLLPNLQYLIVISFTLEASSVILAESVLTFIGIGVEPGTASWGVMLVEAQKELTRTPPIWWVFAGSSFLGIVPLVLSLNIYGDALRDALDPRLKGG